jgi:hypothetical protein
MDTASHSHSTVRAYLFNGHGGRTAKRSQGPNDNRPAVSSPFYHTNDSMGCHCALGMVSLRYHPLAGAQRGNLRLGFRLPRGEERTAHIVRRQAK